jgi:putative SOS response-associated peptidase YedK
MCYSAQIWSDFKKYERIGGELGIAAFVRLFWERRKSGDWVRKLPKGMRDAFAKPRNADEMELAKLVAEGNREAAEAVGAELQAQSLRLEKAEQVLASPKPTKKAANDQRIATDKISRARRDLDDLQRKELLPRDERMFPGTFAPVMIRQDGRKVIMPMRYQCRLPGWSEVVERKYPGTYNARRDKLGEAWRQLFGYNHGLMVVERFYEHVDRDGQDVVLEFVPQDHEPMLVACLWNRSPGYGGAPDLLSFAAITDEPPPEVAAAGHDRCIIQIRPEHVDAWLNPDPANLAAMQAILEDRPRPYYEHRLAA